MSHISVFVLSGIILIHVVVSGDTNNPEKSGSPEDHSSKTPVIGKISQEKVFSTKSIVESFSSVAHFLSISQYPP
ncbi:TPA: hypothetical protein DEP21_02895 [Patescibacteria group bacterium]|nr:hypothetical protein [Candidatus Gracilibacteria bacterium]